MSERRPDEAITTQPSITKSLLQIVKSKAQFLFRRLSRKYYKSIENVWERRK
jgi:hypothetical protein